MWNYFEWLSLFEAGKDVVNISMIMNSEYYFIALYILYILYYYFILEQLFETAESSISHICSSICWLLLDNIILYHFFILSYYFIILSSYMVYIILFISFYCYEIIGILICDKMLHKSPNPLSKLFWTTFDGFLLVEENWPSLLLFS